MADIYVGVKDYDDEVNWMKIDEGCLDLEEHDAEVRDKVIDEVIEIIKSTAWTSVEQIVQRIEDMK